MVVRKATTAKDSRQKPQGSAAKAIVNCSSGDHRKRLKTEAAKIRSKSNRWLLVTRSPRSPQGSAAKAIVNSSSGDHRNRLTTEAARIRSKSNRWFFITQSPQKTHDRSRRDSQQKQSLVVPHAITAKDSRQKPQGFATKAIFGFSSRDHCKRLTTEAARIRSKSNCWFFVTRSLQKTHDRSCKGS